MDIDILKIALAGLLHDIGKFIERTGEEIPDDYIANNQFLYQPKYEGRYSHKHALYTAYFIETFRDYFPKDLIEHSSHEISLINLAAKHHNPNSIEQKIIQEADYLSSGIERKEFEGTEGQARKAYEISLFPILEDISIKNNWKDNNPENFKFRYPLREVSPVNIFPQKNQDCNQEDYRNLYEKFVEVFKNLPHKEFSKLWFEHLDSALFIFTTAIPSATLTSFKGDFKEIISDISLYDHGRLTSSLATAIYIYHNETNSMNEADIKKRDIKKFLMIEGNFYGIQDFIFSEGSLTNKNAAKVLRGRSFYVSLLTEFVADHLLEKLGLPFTSVITNAAGKFKIIAPNTEKSRKIIEEVEEEINDWLIKNFYGEVSIGLTYVEASANDFLLEEKENRLIQLLSKIGRVAEEKKYKKFNVLKHGGSISSYLDNFSEFGICPICNRRSAKLDNKIKEDYLCNICYDHIKIGENLVKQDTILVTTKDASLEDKLKMPIFDTFQVSFTTGDISKLVKERKIIHYWNINSLWKHEAYLKNLSAIKLINGYVPKFNEEYEAFIEQLKYGESQEEIKNIEESFKKKSILSFQNIAKLSLQKSNSGFTGVSALGVFKADIDNLGTIFAKGLRPEKRTFSRYTTLSRQINLFFTLYLPYLCKTEFKSIYTIFAGGDDLFLIGPWSEIIKISKKLSKSFHEYCCENLEITLSAGVFITKSETSVITMAEKSEEALEKAKNKGKNKITIFDLPVEWSKLEEFEKIKSEFDRWLEEDFLTSAYLYKLNDIINMAEEEEKIKEKQILELTKLNPLTWRSKLYYFAIRNIAKKKSKEERLKITEEILQKQIQWIEEHRDLLRIPLWQTIYFRRKA